MVHALEPEARFSSERHVEPGIGLGHVGLTSAAGVNVAWNGDRTRCLFFEGELYDTAALRRSVSEDGAGVAGDADLMLRLYERCPTAFLPKLNGAFVAALWDRREQRLLLFNDRFGLFPLYFAVVNGALLFGSGVRALLADADLNRTVDHLAIQQFLALDHVMDDRTLLTSVRRVPQGSVLTFRKGAVTIEPYWTLRYPDTYELQPEEAYLEQYEHYARQAVARRQPEGKSAAVLLSGGLDSRYLAATLAELGSPVQGLTFGIPGCDDARAAREVARQLGMPHRFFELKEDWLIGLADEAVRLTDGAGNLVNLHALARLEDQSRYAEVLYKGFYGDALFGFAMARAMWGDYDTARMHDVHLAVHRGNGYDIRDRGLFTDQFLQSVGDGLLESYRQGMARAGVSQLGNQRLYFDLTQRAPRLTLQGVEVARSRTIVRLPFCDNDLLDFALTVPPGYLFERHLPKAAFARSFPKLSQIPFAPSGRTLSFCARDVIGQAKRLVSWHLRDAGLGWMLPPERRPYKDYDRWFRTVLRPWVEDTLLAPRALERGYFKPDAVRKTLSDQVAGANNSVRIGAMLSLELWHRQFID